MMAGSGSAILSQLFVRISVVVLSIPGLELFRTFSNFSWGGEIKVEQSLGSESVV